MSLDQCAQWNGAGRRNIARGHLDSMAIELLERTYFITREIEIAQPLHAVGAMMDPSEVHGTNGGLLRSREPGHRVDVRRQENARTLVPVPLIELDRRLSHRCEEHIELGRDAHSIELLLPLAGRHLIVDEHEKAESHRLPPADD